MTYNMEVEINPCYPTVSCTRCGGTGSITTADPVRPHVDVVVPDEDAPPGLAGRWQANDGSEYEFTGSGPQYVMKSRTPMGTLTGHATVQGRRGTLTMTLPMLGRVDSTLQIAADHKSMIVTTTVMGISAGVRFDRVSWPKTATKPPPPPPPEDDPAVAAAMKEAEAALKARDFTRAEIALVEALEAASKTPSPEDDLVALVQLMAMSVTGTRLSDRAVRAYLGTVELLSAGDAAPRLTPHLIVLGTLVPAYGLGGELDARLARAGHAILGRNIAPEHAIHVVLATAEAQHRSGDSDGAGHLLAQAKRVHRDGTSGVRIAQVEARVLFDRQRFAEAFDQLANAVRGAPPDADPAVLATAVIQLIGMWPRDAGGLDGWVATLCRIAERIDEPRRTAALAEAISLLLTMERKAEARSIAPHCDFDGLVEEAPPAMAERVAAEVAEIQRALGA